VRGDDRLAEIALPAQQRVERHLAEQRHVELRGERRAAAGAEDLTGHVLDHAEQAHVRLACHRRGTRGDVLGELLRSRDDDDLGTRQQLPERDRDVAGSGGMSTTSTSISPQCTSVRNCSSARWSIGHAT